MLLSLLTWLWYVNPYLQYVFTAVLFVTSGKRNRMTILLYCVISTYDMVFVCSTAVISIPQVLSLRIY